MGHRTLGVPTPGKRDYRKLDLDYCITSEVDKMAHMVKDIPPPPRLSTRAILVIGICSDALVPVLYYFFEELSFDTRTYPLGYKLLGLALGLCILSGAIGTTVGSAMWAKRASSGAVVFVALAVILLLLIYGNRVSIGFDDPKIVVFPFGSLVVLSLLVGRVIGYILSNRFTSSSH